MASRLDWITSIQAQPPGGAPAAALSEPPNTPSTSPTIPPGLPPSSPNPSSPPPTPSALSLNTLFQNPLFAGGLGLAGLGAAAAFARKSVIRLTDVARRRMVANVEIGKQSEAYPWILSWLAQRKPETGFLASRLTRVNNFTVGLNGGDAAAMTADGSPLSAQLLQPGYGRHVVKYRGAYILVTREKHSSSVLVTGEPHETVQLTTLWSHLHVLEEALTEARQRCQEGKTAVLQARGMDWIPLGLPRRKRPLNSVIFDDGIKERIVDDVKAFLARRDWYADRGIPFRRGYLLHGPPGSGKSSFILALAGELDYSIAMVNLSAVGMTDDKFADLLTRIPRRTILLLEDADAAWVNRRQRDADGYAGSRVTYSGLLNALDGVPAGEERLTFFTTNHIDRLDWGLIRPGRVDMMVEVGAPTKHQAAAMWDRFYGDVDPEGVLRAKFVDKMETLGMFTTEEGVPRTSVAAIQGLFVYNKDNMEGAIEMVESLTPSTVGNMGE